MCSNNTALTQLAEAITDELFNPFAPLLAAGAGLSALVGSTADAGVVAGVVALNAVVGGVQRFRTEQLHQGRRRQPDALLPHHPPEVGQTTGIQIARGPSQSIQWFGLAHLELSNRIGH